MGLPVLNVSMPLFRSSVTFPIPSTLLAALITQHKQLYFRLIMCDLHSWSTEQSVNDCVYWWAQMWHYHPDAFAWLHHSSFPANWKGCLSSVCAHADTHFACFALHNPEQLDHAWMQCKDMQTNRGSLCPHAHALQKELLKSHPWNLQSLSSIAELKVHVLRGFETSRGFVLSRRHRHCAER